MLSGPHLQRSSQARSGHAQDGAQTVQLCCPCYDSFLPRHEALLASFTTIQTGRPKVLESPTNCSGVQGHQRHSPRRADLETGGLAAAEFSKGCCLCF